MVWNWIFFILYSIGAVCSIANMSTVQKTGDRLFRMTIATVLYILTNFYGTIIMIELLGI